MHLKKEVALVINSRELSFTYIHVCFFLNWSIFLLTKLKEYFLKEIQLHNKNKIKSSYHNEGAFVWSCRPIYSHDTEDDDARPCGDEHIYTDRVRLEFAGGLNILVDPVVNSQVDGECKNSTTNNLKKKNIINKPFKLRFSQTRLHCKDKG